MDRELERRLLALPSLPTAPAVALRLLELCRSPAVDAAAVSAAVARDPALAAKVLRVANGLSPGARGRHAGVAAAAEALGANALVALALSFSLPLGRRRADAGAPEPGDLQARAAAAAAAAATLAHACGLPPGEPHAAALLQDLGALALGEVARREYAALRASAGGDHAALLAAERASLGTDHAEVGALLARAWGFPPGLVAAVAASHDPPAGAPTAAACAAVGACLAERDRVAALAAASRAGIAAAAVEAAARAADAACPVAAEPIDADACARALAEAREILVLLSFRSAHSADRAAAALRNLSEQRSALSERALRDPLTGLFNRTHAETALPALRDAAAAAAAPLTFALCDVDRFKGINDGYGHATGDAVLQAVAGALTASLRTDDVVIRWGGDELLLALPGTDATGAAIVAERIRRRVAGLALRAPGGEALRVTLSIGYASAVPRGALPSVGALLEAADGALYQAKRGGRDRAVAA